MARDHRKLRVFEQADNLVLAVYRATASFPLEERYGLQAPIRRAAISSAANIVEGCARRSTREYVSFLNISNGSTGDMEYLVTVAGRLGFVAFEVEADLVKRRQALTRGLQNLIVSLAHRE